MTSLSRRGFLAATAATTASLILPARVRAQSARMSLTATTRTIDVRGKAATVWGLMDGNGRSGLVLDPGQAFAVDLTNTLAEPTSIHWHGQIPPNAQDGVPGPAYAYAATRRNTRLRLRGPRRAPIGCMPTSPSTKCYCWQPR